MAGSMFFPLLVASFVARACFGSILSQQHLRQDKEVSMVRGPCCCYGNKCWKVPLANLTSEAPFVASGFVEVMWHTVADLFTHIWKPSGPAHDPEDYWKDDNSENKDKKHDHKHMDGDSVDYGGQGKPPDEWRKEFGPNSGGQNSKGDYCWWKDKNGKWHRSEEKPEDYPEDCPQVTSGNTIVGDPPRREAARNNDTKSSARDPSKGEAARNKDTKSSARDPPKKEAPRNKDTKSSALKLALPSVVILFVVALQWL